jgi:hypothetical protein
MEQDRVSLTGGELLRWLIVVAIIAGGIALFFYFGRSTGPIVPPTVQETAR